MQDMTADKALNSLLKLQTLFRELEYLSDIIKVALAERKATNSVRKERETISAEIADLTPRLASLRTALKAAGDDVVAKTESAERAHRAAIRVIAAKLKEKTAASSEKIEAMEAREREAIADYNSAIIAARKEKASLERDIAGLRGDLDKMRERLAKVA